MDLRKARAIAIKDLEEVFSSLSTYGPMIGVPVFFSILLPVLTFYVTQYAAPNIALKLISATSNLNVSNAKGYLFMRFFSINVLGPIFLTMPILTAAVIAADSFAGEKERKTSEALLSTPVKRSELLLGKIIASFVPTILLTLLVFMVYGGVTNYLAYKVFGQNILPTKSWILMLLTAPLLAIATISVIVLVSSHVRNIKEAQQISTLLVLPMLIMPFVSILGFADLSVSFFVYLNLGLLILDTIILYIGVKSFKREYML